MVRLMPFALHLHFPVFLPVSFPPSYRGRGNRGKGSAFLFSGHFGNRGKTLNRPSLERISHQAQGPPVPAPSSDKTISTIRNIDT